MDHMNATIPCKLPFQCSGQRGIKLEEKQMRIRSHPSRDLTRVHAFAGTILCNHSRLGEIHLACDAFHKRLGTRYDRRDLKGTLQETLEKKCAHGKRTFVAAVPVV